MSADPVVTSCDLVLPAESAISPPSEMLEYPPSAAVGLPMVWPMFAVRPSVKPPNSALESRTLTNRWSSALRDRLGHGRGLGGSQPGPDPQHSQLAAVGVPASPATARRELVMSPFRLMNHISLSTSRT